MELETRLINEKQFGYGTVNTSFDAGGMSEDDVMSETDLSTTSPSPYSTDTSLSEIPMIYHRPLMSQYSRRLDRLNLVGLTPYNWEDIRNSNDPTITMAALKCLAELPVPLSEKHRNAIHLRRKLNSQSESKCNRCCACLLKWIKAVYSFKWLDCLDKYTKNIEGFFGKGVSVYFSLMKFFIWLDFQVVFFTLLFVVLPQLCFNYFSFFDTSQSGWEAFRWSLFFYGFYQNVVNAEVFAVANLYFVTTCKNFLSAFKSVVSGLTNTYRRRKQNVVTGTCVYSKFIFGSWDYSIFRKDAVVYQHLTFTRQLKRMLEEEFGYAKCNNGRFLHVTRVLTNIAYVLMLALGCFVVNRCALAACHRGKPFLQYFLAMETNQLAIVLALIKNLIPWFIRFLSWIEKWKKPTGDYAYIIRTALYTSLLLVVLDFSMVSYFRNRHFSNVNNITYCWETEIGVQYFRIFGFDLIIGFVVVFFTDIVWAILVGCGFMTKRIGYREFDVIWAVNDLIFTQTLMWMAVYFSPLLPILGLVKYLALFGFRYYTANLTNAPPNDILSPPRSGKTMYMSLVLMALLMSVFPRAFVLLSVQPSSNCGPFMMVKRYTYDVFTGRVIESVPYAVDYFFNYILSAQTTVPLIIILILLIVYYRVQSGQYEKILHRMNGRLTMESRRSYTASGINTGYAVDLSKGRLGDFP